jgi:hypothetical protein
LTFDFEIKSSALGKLLKFKAKIIYYYWKKIYLVCSESN